MTHRSQRLIVLALAAASLSPLTLLADPRPLSPTELALINRLSWGMTGSQARVIAPVGVEAWLQGQLHPRPGDHLPGFAQARIDALAALHKPATQLTAEMNAEAEDPVLQQQQQALDAPPPAQSPAAPIAMMGVMQASPPPAAAPLSLGRIKYEIRARYRNNVLAQTATRDMLRDLYSPDQLREQMTWFWFNHFNVFVGKGEIAAYIADYEDNALRPNALGNFRTLLEATLRSPAMMQYLDNAQNNKGQINENYAREIMELHTMGVGSGYTQKDVQELARILTGCGLGPVNGPIKAPPNLQSYVVQNGMFAFYPQRHDFGDKVFLGHAISGAGFAEVEQALDILASQPATARHVSRRLAQYFVADQPPASLVNAMADRFLATNGDIAAVLDLMFHSAEFRASLGQPLLKDPQHYVVSAVRMAYDTTVVPNTRPMLGWMDQLGEPLYGRLTPDGYALDRTAWNGPGQIEQRFEVARTIGGGAKSLFTPDGAKAPVQPADPQLQSAVYYSGLINTFAPATQGTLGQARSAPEWNTFLLASPDFMRR